MSARWLPWLLVLAISCTPSPAPDLAFPALDEVGLVEASALLAWGRRVDQREQEVLIDALRSGSPGELMEALTRGPEYEARWQAALYDLLAIDRVGPRALPSCFGTATIDAPGPELAQFVRDAGPDQAFGGDPTMTDVVASALVLDDLAPVLLANLFAELANDDLEPDDLEAPGFRAVRANDFGARLLGRTAVCVSCHSSEFGVTDSDAPEDDRHHPHEAALDSPVFGGLDGLRDVDLGLAFRRREVIASMVDGWTTVGEPDGCSPEPEGWPGCNGCACEESVCALVPACCTREWDGFCAQLCIESAIGCDAPSASGFVPVPWTTPFGLAPACGVFVEEGAVASDTLQDEGFLAGPLDADSSVWELHRRLAAALDGARGEPLARGDGLSTERALATLIALRIADGVWTLATGTPLTVTHGFPRDPAQQEVLVRLGDALTSSGWSLRALLSAVADEPGFAPALADDAYSLPRVWNPWSTEAEDPAERGNGAGDRVRPLRGRDRVSSAHALMGWPAPIVFPAPVEQEVPAMERLEDLGAYVGDGAPGFEGIDLQAGLAWEEFAAGCRPPDPIGVPGEDGCLSNPGVCPRDFVDALVDAAQATGASQADAVWALRARLLGDAAPSGDAETDALFALLESDPAAGVPDWRGLRRVCGAMLMAPQFTHRGVPRGPGDAPTLVVPGTSYDAVCAALTQTLSGDAPGARLLCDDGATLQ